MPAEHSTEQEQHAREVDGEFERAEIGVSVLSFRREFEAPLERVWRCVSDREGTKLWLNQVDQLEPEVGAAFLIRTYDENMPAAWTSGIVTEVEAPRLLEYTWNQGPFAVGPAVQSRVRFELQEESSITTLALTHTLYDPGGRPYVPIFLSAWHFHLDALARGLAGLHDSFHDYVDRLVAESGLPREQFFTGHVGAMIQQYSKKFGLRAS